MDYLQCNPHFHGQEHYDCVLIHTIDHQNNGMLTFARLQFMFEYTVGNEPLHLTLVTPFYIPPGEKCAIDKDLRLIRLHARSVASSQIITLQSIIRGVLLVPDFTNDGNYFLCNYINGDMFLHSQTFLS